MTAKKCCKVQISDTNHLWVDISVQASADVSLQRLFVALDLHCWQWLGFILSQTFLGSWHAIEMACSCFQFHKSRAFFYQRGKFNLLDLRKKKSRTVLISFYNISFSTLLPPW